MLVIKKYPNRRLYDTAQSRYITLEDLAARIKAGSDVLVQDAATGADLTQVTLTQIVLESRNGARLLPVPLLLRLIRLGDEALAEFLGRYVSWALEMYVQARQGARALLPMNPLVNAPFAATDALARLVLGATKWGAAPAGAAGQGASLDPSASAATSTTGEMPAPAAQDDPIAYIRDLPHMPTGQEVAAAIGAETAHVHGEVSDMADDVARLRRELEALKRSMNTESRAQARQAKSMKTIRKSPSKKRP
jgi:polyhydroxyalkanoate synthesis repressor PhaR